MSKGLSAANRPDLYIHRVRATQYVLVIRGRAVPPEGALSKAVKRYRRQVDTRVPARDIPLLDGVSGSMTTIGGADLMFTG